MNLLLNQQKNITLLAKYIRYWNLERTLLKKLQKIELLRLFLSAMAEKDLIPRKSEKSKFSKVLTEVF